MCPALEVALKPERPVRAAPRQRVLRNLRRPARTVKPLRAVRSSLTARQALRSSGRASSREHPCSERSLDRREVRSLSGLRISVELGDFSGKSESDHHDPDSAFGSCSRKEDLMLMRTLEPETFAQRLRTSLEVCKQRAFVEWSAGPSSRSRVSSASLRRRRRP